MPDTISPTSPELDNLRGDYDIVGELGGHSTMRAVIATRRSAEATGTLQFQPARSPGLRSYSLNGLLPAPTNLP